MIRLAFCDDDFSQLQKLETYLEKYEAQQEQKISCSAFRSPLELLAAIERGERFDVLFLDILMPGETGIDAAAEIRQYDSNVKIIFLSSSAEYAVQSYGVGAFYYQLKPIGEECFIRLLDSVLSQCRKEKTSSLILRCKNGITRMEPKELEYCKVSHRTLLLHLESGRTLECSGSLDELSQQLAPYGCFLRVHRSYLVNLEYVTDLSFRAIVLSSGIQIPIPRGKYNEIKNAFLEYAFRNGQVAL